MKKVTLYTDGACSGNPGIGGWAYILIYNGHEKRGSGVENKTTNNRMEMFAIIEALLKLKEPCEVEIYSDSAYTVNGFNLGWIYNWEKNGWKKADNKPLLNDDLWKSLWVLARAHKLTFIKVKGHADNEYNNQCDKMATGAIKQYEKELGISI